MDIQKILNANIYLGATNSLLGKASEIVLPEIAAATEEHKALGMIGAVEVVTGLALMTGSIKWAGFYEDALTVGTNPFAAIPLQVRASVETWGPAGRTLEQALVVLLTCTFKKVGLGTFAAQANSDRTMEYSTTYVKASLQGKELVEVDVHNNVWRVGGVDVLTNFRANLGA